MKTLAVAVLFFATNLLHAQVDSTTDIVEDGKMNAVIVIGEDGRGCVRFAAKELSRYIKKICGTAPKIKVAPKETDESLPDFVKGKIPILVGESVYVRNLGLKPNNLGADSFFLKISKENIVVAGKDDSVFNLNYDKWPSSTGTLYGVYYLLEMMGCRWFYPISKLEVTPENKTIALPPTDVVKRPYFEYRFAYGDYLWRRKLGYGGIVDPWATRHTFSQTIKIKRKYPRIFENGVHFHHSGVIDAIANEAIAFLKKREPVGKKYFLMIPSDGYKPCECEKCKPFTTPERGVYGSLSDYVGSAVVEVAKKASCANEGKIVYCAYENYTLPPLKIKKLPKNVVLLLALGRARFNSAKEKKRVWSIIDAWRRLSPSKVYFCRYYNDFLKLTPSFAPHLISEDIKRMKDYAKNGLMNICGEMNFGGIKPTHPYAWWFCINEYVTAKLLWDPDLSVDALLQDYYSKFFGSAAKPMSQFFKRLEDLFYDEKECYLYSTNLMNILKKLKNWLKAPFSNPV
jgi:hypothetical protein